MRTRKSIGTIGIALAIGSPTLAGEPMISAGDPVIAIDEDITSSSRYPGAESPSLAIDGSTASKYLNFGRENSGIIITPSGGAKVLRSFMISTANDSSERDPAGVIVYGTNLPVVSADNSAGNGESWTRLAELPLSLPDTRNSPGPVVEVNNSVSYASYKFIFTSMKGPGHNSMQISELQGWAAGGAGGDTIFAPGDPVLAVHEASGESSFPAVEGPENLFDENPSSKYLNFGRENSGFIVTPSSGPAVAGSFVITTANDYEGRDPVEWEIYGTNATIVTENNGTGQNEPWEFIASVNLVPPSARLTESPEVFFANDTAYTSYKLIVRALRDPVPSVNIDSTQLAEFQLFTSDSTSELEIISIATDLENDEIIISWNGPGGKTYSLETSGDLVAWDGLIANNLTVENDSTYRFAPPVGTHSKLFFRLVPN